MLLYVIIKNLEEFQKEVKRLPEKVYLGKGERDFEGMNILISENKKKLKKLQTESKYLDSSIFIYNF